jgi:hypothetical protein
MLTLQNWLVKTTEGQVPMATDHDIKVLIASLARRRR